MKQNRTEEVKMSAKSFHSFRDEHRDLHKQIGCMSGIFQLFDRRHFISGRSLNGHSHKRLPPGISSSAMFSLAKLK